VLSPDIVRHLEHSQIRGLKLRHGRREYRLDDFFEVDGEKSDCLRLQGDLSKVRWIGYGMCGGSIYIRGDVGMHLGAHMQGGSIRVDGDVGDWLGAEMKQGSISVSGNAGNRVGGSYRGSLVGMRNGSIFIAGSAGLELGLRMRRGLIVVASRVREFVGLHMKGGTIVLRQGADARAGAWMKRGTILSFAPLEILPSFHSSGDFNSPFLGVLQRQLLAGVPWGAIADSPASLVTASQSSLASACSPQDQPGTGTPTPTPTPTEAISRSDLNSADGMGDQREWLVNLGWPTHWERLSFRRYVGDRTLAGQGEILVVDPSSLHNSAADRVPDLDPELAPDSQSCGFRS
ncbi:MAG: formylmethanofuran dehydrogenase subunit C, partial [bacterium]|nr:formylmethanofuran dehydrogenase subunit C [bacterium]